jgi:chemotaxis protein methyltransferase CheR
MFTASAAENIGDAAALRPSHFDAISRIVYERCGICFPKGKETLVSSRLAKRLRILGLTDYGQYLDYLKQDTSGAELATMIDALTTNKTNFFREPHHFDFLRTNILPELRDSDSKIRFWSAGCSTGEEPYSLAILLSEELSQPRRKNCQILATDISRRVLSVAREGVYSEEALRGVNPSLWKKHMVCTQTKPSRTYKISDEAHAMIHFAYLNLTEAWPMHGPFDAIFCRNVMIYFDGDTRKRLVRRFYDLIKPGGYLFVGHSESLGSNSREFRYVEPAIYVK